MGVTALDRDQDTAPSTSDLDQATTGAASGDLPYWLTDGSRWNLTPSQAFGRSLLNNASAPAVRALLGLILGSDIVKPVPTYAALTELTSTTGLVDNGTYCTYGRTAEEDGGFGFWRYDSGSSATANGGTILAIDGGGAGRFFRLLDAAKTHHVAWFGANGAASHTVNTLAIQACAAAVGTLGTGHVEFDGSQSYAIYGDTSNTNALGDFDGCKGVYLKTNGCNFTVARAFTGVQVLFAWLFENCDGYGWGDHTVTCAQEDDPDVAYTRGLAWLTILNRNTQGSGGFVKMIGGRSCVDPVRTSSTVAHRSTGLRVMGIECEHVGYPLSLRNSGDDTVVFKHKATDCSRPVIGYGFKKFRADVERVSTGLPGEAEMLFLANGTGSELELGDPVTEDVDIKYTSNVSPANACAVAVEARGTSAVALRDIVVRYNQKMNGASGLSQQSFVTYKTSSSGVFDSTTRGHTFENCLLTGSIRDVPAGRIFDFFRTAGGDWAGETVRGFRVRDLIVTGSASATYEIDMDGFVDGPFFENFTFPGTPTVTGTVPDTFTEVGVKDIFGLRTLAGGATVRTAGGRLSLTSAVPVTVSDVTAATTVYYAIDKDSRAPFWMGFRFAEAKFTELSLALSSDSGHTGYHQADKNFDAFLINDAGTLRLATGPAWSSDTARGTGAGTTELARTDGFYTNAVAITARFGSASGNTVSVAAGRALYVGTFRCTANGQTEDSLAKRFVWNCFNQRARPMRVLESTDTWAGSGSASWRQANNSAANQLDFLCGLNECPVRAQTGAIMLNSTSTPQQILQGIGLDATTGIATGCTSAAEGVGATLRTLRSSYEGMPGLGRHRLTWLEFDSASDTRTYYGDTGLPASFQSGITGEVFA